MIKIITLPKILDDRGNLSFFENNSQIPFSIKKVYWIYDVPAGMQRGGYACKELHEVIITLSGSLDVVLHDGIKEQRFVMNRPDYGLYIPKGVWRNMENFSTNSLTLVVTDGYGRDQYIRDFEEFKKTANGS